MVMRDWLEVELTMKAELKSVITKHGEVSVIVVDTAILIIGTIMMPKSCVSNLDTWNSVSCSFQTYYTVCIVLT